jgi:hypothetical protein
MRCDGGWIELLEPGSSETSARAHLLDKMNKATKSPLAFRWASARVARSLSSVVRLLMDLLTKGQSSPSPSTNAATYGRLR